MVMLATSAQCRLYCGNMTKLSCYAAQGLAIGRYCKSRALSYLGIMSPYVGIIHPNRPERYQSRRTLFARKKASQILILYQFNFLEQPQRVSGKWAGWANIKSSLRFLRRNVLTEWMASRASAQLPALLPHTAHDDAAK